MKRVEQKQDSSRGRILSEVHFHPKNVGLDENHRTVKNVFAIFW